jgi:hypothetical protein
VVVTTTEAAAAKNGKKQVFDCSDSGFPGPPSIVCHIIKYELTFNIFS